jgi:vacuolar protein sorting-associated protein 26
VKRAFGETVVERDVWAETFAPSLPLDFDNGWQLEVGLEDQLHIHFDTECSRFALTDSIIGTISFAIVSALRIKSADLSLVRREIVGNRITDQEALVKAQVLDGPAQAGDVVKFKLPLANLRDLTPTLKDVEKSMHLCYFVNLIIYDDQGHRYFKQQEVELFRPLPVETAAPNSHVIALRDLL